MRSCLVHNVTSLVGRPPAFFEEGAAVAHEGYNGLLSKRRNNLNYQNPLDFMEMSIYELVKVPSGAGYEVAGRFTGYLMTTYGMDAYLDFYRTLEQDADLVQIDAAFQETLGVRLDDSIAEYLDSWTSCWADPLLSECEAPEVAWDGELLEYQEEVFCDKGDAIGPYDVTPVLARSVVQRTITIMEEATYELRLAGDMQESTENPDVASIEILPYHGVSLTGCAPCINDTMETREGGTPRISRLRPGRYSLRLHGPQFDTVPVAFTLKKVE